MLIIYANQGLNCGLLKLKNYENYTQLKDLKQFQFLKLFS